MQNGQHISQTGKAKETTRLSVINHMHHEQKFVDICKVGEANVLRQDPPPPLEAILVIFGRRALLFFLFESSWKKMKNDTTFVRMRSGDHLGDAKMSKKGTSIRRI